MPGTFTGLVLDPASNKVLWQHTPDTPLVPGSTAKLITTSAALLTLNPTSSLVTRVVVGGTPGAVVLVGGGDPTLTALPQGKVGVYPDPARLTDLAAQVKKATGGAVTKVVIDTSRYRGPGLAPGWDESDIAGGDVTPITPLMLDGGRVDPTQQDGARVPDPAQQAGLAFAKLLGLGKSAVSTGTAPPDADVLGSVASAPVAELVETLLQKSDNVLAEVLARETAIARGGEPSFDGAVEAAMAALTQAGIPTTGAAMVDGSGLSRRTRCPPSCWPRCCPRRPRPRRAPTTRSSCGRCSRGCRWRGRRHAGGPVHPGRRLVGGARRRPREDRHADDGEQPGGRGRRRGPAAARVRVHVERGAACEDPAQARRPCGRAVALRVPLTRARGWRSERSVLIA